MKSMLVILLAIFSLNIKYAHSNQEINLNSINTSTKFIVMNISLYSLLDSSLIIQEATNGEFQNTYGKYDQDCGGEYSAELIDLNDDGQHEVFIYIGGSCLSGIAGSYMELYIKDKNGVWETQFGFDGWPKILDTRNLGYPDIEIEGPGFCFPIWRWNGERYEIYKRCDKSK